MKDIGPYQLDIEDNRLSFVTSSFMVERGSILHRGIYNRELASALSASLIGGMAFVFLFFRTGNKLILYIFPLLVFMITFLFFRTAVFKEPRVEAIFDRGLGKVSLIVKRPFRVLYNDFPIGSLSDVVMEYGEFEPLNPDGIALVERIALQHGTVIPGFGEKKDFYKVDLSFTDKRTTIFVTEKRQEAEEILKKIKAFLGRSDGDNL